MTKIQKYWFRCRKAHGVVDCALLDAASVIYSESFAEKICSRKDWRERILQDLQESLEVIK